MFSIDAMNVFESPGEGICVMIRSDSPYGLWLVFTAEVILSSLKKQQGGCFTNPITLFP